MKSAFLMFVSILALASCTSPTPKYRTTCTESVCNLTATHIEPPVQATEGIPIVLNAALQINLDRPAVKIIQQNDTLILFIDNGTRIATSPMSLDSLELNDSGVTITRFMEWVFLNDFKALESEKLSDDLLAAVRQWKLSSFEYMTPAYFKRDQLTAFYYLADTDHYQMVVLSDNRDTAIMIDLYGFNEKNFTDFVSTLGGYK